MRSRLTALPVCLLWWLLTGLLPVGQVRAQPAGPAPLLTLDEAVRMAAEQNYTVRMARNEAHIAANDYSLGNAGIWPTLSVSAQQSRRSFGSYDGGEPAFGTLHTFDLAMNLNATLFDGFGQLATYERLASQKEQAALGAARTTETALAGVAVAYYDLVRQQQQIAVLREAVELSEERLRIASLQRDLGSASEMEVRRAQVDLNADRAALLRQEVSLDNARASFSQLIGRTGSLDFRVADTLHVDPTLDVAGVRAAALQQNKTLALARQARETAVLGRREVQAAWWPALSLQAGYAFSDLTQDLGLPGSRPPGLNYGLTATFDVFDGFNRRRRLENAALRLRNSELAVEEATTQLATRLENAFASYRNSLQLVDLERENVALAGLNVEVALERFRQGTITSIELREVQNALTSAESRFLTAQFEAKRAEVELRQLGGVLEGGLLPAGS